jgi:hypothetical protein
MGKLTSKARNDLPASDFVFPKTRKFPIENRSHGANAKARATNKSPAVRERVDAAVDRKYPGMGKKDKK